MIPRSAIKAFLGPRDDHDWMKGLTHKQLDTLLREAHAQVHPILGHHQKVSVVLGISYPRFSFWLDMGAGKTLISLELLKYWFQRAAFRRAIVFLKTDKAFPTWERQIKEYGIEVPCVALEGDSVKRWKTLERFGNGIVLVPYPGAVAMVSHRVKKKGKKGKMELKLQDSLIDRLGRGVGAVIIDESTVCGDQGSLTHRLVKRLAHRAAVVHALAGRPVGRDPTVTWAQQVIVDEGESLGETLGLFRAAFFSAEPNPFVNNDYIKDYTFKKSMQPELARLMRHRSIIYTSEECGDLPACRNIVEEVRLGADVGAYYAEARDALLAAHGNFRELKSVFMRMRQMSSGFLGFKDDDTGERAQVEFDTNPKLERLLELLSELPQDRKAVVFYDFTYSGRRISEELTKAGQGNIWLWSGTKDYRADLKSFTERPTTQVAVINNKVGAFSLDGLQVANYTFFYESPVSVIERDQAHRRVLRQGQKHKVFEYDLVTAGTVDRKILAFHKEGRDLYKALSSNPKGLL